MRTIAIMLAGSALFALGACGKSEDKADSGGETQSAQEIAAQVKKVSLQPGEWETTSEIIDARMENAPEGMPAGMMNSMKGRKTTVRNCITPEQAENPGADFLAAQKDGRCTYSGFEMSGGTIRGTVTCAGDGSGTATMKMEGVYTPTSYTTTVDMQSAGMAGAQAKDMTMHMTTKVSGKRIGECPAPAKP